MEHLLKMSDLIEELGKTLRFERQRQELERHESYIDQLEMDNTQLSIEYNKIQEKYAQLAFNHHLLELNMSTAMSHIENLKLISSINKQFVRLGVDPWRKQILSE